MAANFGDLAQSLIEGGLAPQAARIIANALANAASPTFSTGRDQTDATPTAKLRLITPDTRRYELTNLDYSPSVPFNDRLSSSPTIYDPGNSDHPYKDSQPVTSAPPLSNPRVQGDGYITVENIVDGGAAVSKVGLKIRLEPGRHLRLDPSTKSLEGVPLTATSQSSRFLAAEFQEVDGATELVLSLRNLTEISALLANGDSRRVWVFPEAAAAGPAGLAAGGTRSLTRKAVRWADGTSQDILAWTDGGVTDAPAGPAAVCRAWVVFDGATSASGTSANRLIAASSGVASVERVTEGRFIVRLASGAVSGANYAVTAIASRTTDDQTTTHIRFDPAVSSGDATVTSSQFTVVCRTQANNGVDARRVSVSVFQ
ncbi:MAG: hypothetical protein ACK52I_26315 [Pseudomonadota bacterium]